MDDPATTSRVPCPPVNASVPTPDERHAWRATVAAVLDRLADDSGPPHARSRPAARRCLLFGLGQGAELEALLEQATASALRGQPVDLVILPGRWVRADALRSLATRLQLQDQPLWRELIARWPPGLPGLHRIELMVGHGACRPRVIVGCGEADRLLRQLAWPIDGLVILAGPPGADGAWDHPDPAAPGDAARTTAQPPILAALKARTLPGALLLCDISQAAMHDAIGASAFERQAIPLHAHWPPHVALARRRGAAPAAELPRALTALTARATVAVVGAGLAGSACAAALAREGWRVLLVDACPDPVAGNRQPRLADHPHLSPDDNLLARLSRQGLAAAHRWRSPCSPSGRLQLAADPDDAGEQRRACAALGPYADAFARPVDADEAAELAGLALDRGGLWLPGCEAHDPAALARRWRAAPGVEARFGRAVVGWRQRDDGWHLLDHGGGLVARADAIVLAAGATLPAQAAAGLPAMQRLRGQSTRVHAPALRALRCIVAGRGYVCPLDDADALVGASTDPRDDTAPDTIDDQANLARLHALIPSLARHPVAPRIVGSAVGRRASPSDRLPLVGGLVDDRVLRDDWQTWARNDRRPLPYLDGIHVLAGLGARGSLWAPLGAELIADRLAGRMPALERDLLEAIDPGRFLRQRLRRGLAP